ncbi:MAG: hypothetical protein KKC84_03025 [Candidatus Omnitrophica bacterium]|nr:hypothetical protein [Candidatus Omnitrophota bacterium]
MQDLLFKNLTSIDKRRKIISCSEILDKEGVRSIVRRHFVYFIREIVEEDLPEVQERPQLFVIKERDTKLQREKFFCKIKGYVYVVKNQKKYQITYIHSLKVVLAMCSS